MWKAYHRVEWSFLEAIMLKFGLDKIWVLRVMGYVRTVSSIFINGKSSLLLWVFVRVNPISLSLILCAKVFFNLITRVEESRGLKGVRVALGALAVWHVLFLDNILVQQTMSDVLKDILVTYEIASGQKLNLDNTDVLFSGGGRGKESMAGWEIRITYYS